ncbi:pilus assembly protein PilM [bacterium]|nr:pilus assembly protein PilM [bacterium]
MQLKSFKIEKKKPWSFVLGLDISSNALKYLLLRRTGRGLRVDGFGRYALENGELERDQKIQQSVGSLFQKIGGLKQAKVVLGIDSGKLTIKKESMPALARKELLQTIAFSMQEEIRKDVGAGEVVCDYLTLGPDPAKPAHMQYLSLGILEEVVENEIRYCAAEGIIPTKVTPTVLAMTNLVHFIPKMESNDAVGFLDIGTEKSVLVIIRNRKMDFFREIVIGGDDFTKSIIGTIFHEGRAIQFTEEDAAEFKYRYGYPLGFSEGMMFRGAPLTEVGAMMRPVVERLSGEIHRSIGFYKDQSASGNLNKLYLIGGGARLKHLSDVLTEKIGIPVSPLHMPKDLRVSGGKKYQEGFQKKFLEQAISFALAMETSTEGNLLPTPYRKIHQMAVIQKGFRYAAMGIVVLIAFLTFHFQSQVHSLKNRVIAKEILANQIQSVRSQYNLLQLEKNILDSKIAALRLSIQSDDHLVQVLRMVSHSVPEKLLLTGLEYGQAREMSRMIRENTETEEPDWIVRIEGVSNKPSNDVGIYLAQLMVELEKSQYFSNVTLADEQVIQEEGQEDTYRFELIGYLKDGTEEDVE